MVFVHDGGTEASLPEMTDALAARLNGSDIASVHAGQRTTQTVLIGQHQDEVNVVRGYSDSAFN